MCASPGKKMPNKLYQAPPVETDTTENGRVSVKQFHRGLTQKLYALVIGIDRYPNLDSLKGAIADLNDMENFLKHDLGVSAEHIVTLRNEQATRSRIIQEFRALWNNSSIQHGDPILIYYAGHGGLAKANKRWKERHGNQQIQVIFPFDYQCEVPGPTKPVRVNCIPDRTIATLLNKLASEKGDNITVIFDSCHSASGTRADAIDPGQQAIRRDRRYRNAIAELDIPYDIDDDLFASDGIQSSLPAKQQRDAQLLLHTDQNSHIHFAACGTHEQAAEEYGRGVFTGALLKKIRESGIDNITYHNLVKCLVMKSKNQSPQCYGKHKDRIIFNSCVSSRKITFVSVIFKDDAWILEAGDASGVTLGSEWELHETPTENSISVGRFKVIDLYASDAILEPLDSIGTRLRSNDDVQLHARCIRIGGAQSLALRVWVSSRDLELLFKGVEYKGKIQEGGIGYIITSNRDNAQVALEVCPPALDYTLTREAMGAAQAEVIFYLCDHLAKQYGVERLLQRKPALREEVEVVLFAAARWCWHLQRGNYDSKMSGQMVSMRMLRVANRSNHGHSVNRLPKPELVPMDDMDSAHGGPNQIDARINPPNTSTSTASSSLMVDGLVDFMVDSSLYGFKCNSKMNTSLYVRMFYFNAADFSIDDMFGHNAGIGENILPAGDLLIGDGADGGSAIRFKLPPGQQVELGYMKVFWSTRPLELDHIKQKSAFDMKPGEQRGAEVFRDVAAEKWGTTCLALILRRNAKVPL